jgi:capping protein alpha
VAVETLFEDYAKKHFPDGITAVYGSSSQDQITIDLCLEDHVYSPENFW